MALIKTRLTEHELILSHKGEDIAVPLYPQGGKLCKTVIWDDHCDAKTVNPLANEWLSDQLNIACRLVYQPDNVVRQVDPRYANPSDKVNFTDGFPFLVLSQASLDSLNQAMNLQLPVQRFRPNLVVDNCASYAEDQWREISINNIHFRLPKPCSRCVVTTINTNNAESGKEPLTTLNRLRKWNNQVYFGQNALHDQPGTLGINQQVQIKQSGLPQPPL